MKNKLTYSCPIVVEENGKEVTYELGFQRLKRSQIEESEIFFSKIFHKRVSEGIQPAAVLQKRLLDQGGLYDSEHVKKYEKILADLGNYQTEWATLASDLENKEKNAAKILDLSVKMSVLTEQAKEYDLSRFSATEHTAEAYAANDTVRWIALLCAVVKKTEDKEFAPFFKGNTHEERLADFDNKEESEDKLYLAALPIIYVAAALARIGVQDPEIVKEEIEKRNLLPKKEVKDEKEEVKVEPPATT